MIKKYSGTSKDFIWVFLLLVLFSLCLVTLAFLQSPLNSFEDDARWLVPSLAWDMSSLSWPEQLSRDVGERGALSLNMMLRFLYLVFGSWPTGYILFGIFSHTICTFLMFVALRKWGVERITAFATTVTFFFCSLQFHAIFWIIGVQHVIAVASILATSIIANHILRRSFCQYKSLNVWHYALALVLLLVLGINRTSIVFNLITMSLIFTYYALKLGGVANGSKKLSSSWRLYGFYAAGMLAIPAFSFYQFSRQGEGWQVIDALQLTGIPTSLIKYFSNIFHLYIGFMFSLGFICMLVFLVSIYPSRLARKHFANLCYFLGVAGIAATILFLEKTRYVLPAILENLFSVPDVNVLNMRWSPIDVFRFESGETTNLVNAALCVILLLIFAYAKPKKNSAKLLSATFLFMVAFGLAYFNSLTNPPLNLNAIPSRYTYYFTPAIILALFHALVRFLSLRQPLLASCNSNKHFFLGMNLASNFRMSGLSYFGKWQLIKKGGVVLLVASLVFTNVFMLYERLDHSKVFSFYGPFGSHPSFMLAESIASWAKHSKHVGGISINLSGFKGIGWNLNPYMGSFIPPANTIFDPFIFSVQAFLTQMIGQGARLHTVPGSADIMLCGGKWYGRTSRPAISETAKCETSVSSLGNSSIPDEFLQDGGFELQLLKPRHFWESSLMPKWLKDFPLSPRYEASLADGIDFKKPGYPNFLAEVSGLYGPEDWGRWTDGPVAKFRFKQPLPKKFTLVISFSAIAPNVGKQAIVRAGKIVRKLTIESPSSTAYTLHFEGVDGIDTLEIAPPIHARPIDLNPDNPDTRSLGLGMIYLKIKQ